jgi:Mg-chelatase subunit ChlD
MNWEERQIAPGEESGFTVQLSLLQPVFSPLFLRWDLPAFLSLENNLIFPREFPVTIQAADFSNPPASGATLVLQLPDEIIGDASPKVITFSENYAYQTRQLTSREIFEDQIVTVTATCEKGGVLLDQISRNVFIPATPVSDTGLVVTIDTVLVDKLPEISFVFWAEIAASQQKIFKLRPENLFLYENEERIRDFSIAKETGGGFDLVDVIFVLDVSGSMGNEINEVRENIVEFADSLVARGFDFRIGVVTFSTTVDDVWDLTDDVRQIQQNLAGIQLWGGVEDSPAALYRATELSLRPGSKRTIIWITDEPYPETTYTKEEIVNRMLSLDITVNGVGLTELQTDWFDPIVLPTGGNFYDINGNFRDILLDISRLESSFLHRVTYTSPSSGTGTQQIRLKIHYAGLGGEATIDYTRSGMNAARPLLACYPNPFNPQTKIYIDNPAQSSGEVAIYNLLGQKVKEFSVSPKQRAMEILWDARDERELPVATGLYFVQLSLRDQFGKIQTQAIRKVLYVK